MSIFEERYDKLPPSAKARVDKARSEPCPTTSGLETQVHHYNTANAIVGLSPHEQSIIANEFWKKKGY